MSLSQLGIVKKQKEPVRNLRRILRLDIDNSRTRIFEEFIGFGRASCYCRQSEPGARCRKEERRLQTPRLNGKQTTSQLSRVSTTSVRPSSPSH